LRGASLGKKGEDVNTLPMHPPVLWPLVVYFVGVLFLVGSMIGMSYVLGQTHQEGATGEPYESGIVSTGTAQVRLSAKFYLVAMFFVIFDLEAVFLFAWAIASRDSGWAGYLEALVFIGILVAALIYLWRTGALDWGPTKRRRDIQRSAR
jgi:NADH-quinone oxidoreductase subunit A